MQSCFNQRQIWNIQESVLKRLGKYMDKAKEEDWKENECISPSLVTNQGHLQYKDTQREVTC